MIAHFHVHLNRCFGCNFEETNCGSLLPAMISQLLRDQKTNRLIIGDWRFAIFSPQSLKIDAETFSCVLLSQQSVTQGDPNKLPDGVAPQKSWQPSNNNSLFLAKTLLGHNWCIARSNFFSWSSIHLFIKRHTEKEKISLNKSKENPGFAIIQLYKMLVALYSFTKGMHSCFIFHLLSAAPLRAFHVENVINNQM